MISRLVTGIVATAAMVTTSRADVINVPGDAPTIQAGIDLAVAGDTVVIACGTYTWTSEGSGDADGLVRLKTGVTVTSESGLPDCVVIDGEGMGRVLFADGVLGAQVTGITVHGGDAGPATGLGGGLQIVGGFVTVARCVFRENAGAAIECFISGPSLFEECLIADNDRGGVVVCDSNPTFTRCVLVGNESPFDGGAFDLFFGGNPTIDRCTIVGNTAPTGAGVAAGFDSDPTITGTIIAFNLGGEGLWCHEDPKFPSEPVLSCTDIFGNAGGDWIGCISDQAGTAGNFSIDPELCDVGAGDLGLRPASPCLGGPCVIVGALGACVPGDVDGNGVVDVCDLLELLAAWGSCEIGAPCPADLDQNGTVGVDDLLAVLANWS
jgi:hypothetical protein